MGLTPTGSKSCLKTSSSRGEVFVVTALRKGPMTATPGPLTNLVMAPRRLSHPLQSSDLVGSRTPWPADALAAWRVGRINVGASRSGVISMHTCAMSRRTSTSSFAVNDVGCND
jgi:hypothetical protein